MSKLDKIIDESVARLAKGSAIEIGKKHSHEIKDLKSKISHLESKNVVNDRRILQALSLAVQDTIAVSVTFSGVHRNRPMSCYFKWRSREVEVGIDWANEAWTVGGNDLIHRRFLREANQCPLTDEGLVQLAQAIADYFSGRYKSLKSEIPDPTGDRIDLNEME